MNKKTYFQPAQHTAPTELNDSLFGVIASEEGINDGGEGDDDDDPTAKHRDDSENGHWGDLW